MGGDEIQHWGMWSHVSPERRVPKDHPLRPIRTMADSVLDQMSPKFNRLYSKGGWISIPPEQVLRAMLLQFLYNVRGERMLVEQLEYNLLFRWFVGLNMDGPAWNAAAFKNSREQLIRDRIVQKFLELVLKQIRQTDLLADEHFTVGDFFEQPQATDVPDSGLPAFPVQGGLGLEESAPYS